MQLRCPATQQLAMGWTTTYSRTLDTELLELYLKEKARISFFVSKKEIQKVYMIFLYAFLWLYIFDLLLTPGMFTRQMACQRYPNACLIQLAGVSLSFIP
jgi:hypothetical protein